MCELLREFLKNSPRFDEGSFSYANHKRLAPQILRFAHQTLTEGRTAASKNEMKETTTIEEKLSLFSSQWGEICLTNTSR